VESLKEMAQEKVAELIVVEGDVNQLKEQGKEEGKS